MSRTINPKSLGVKSKDKIIKKFRSVFDVPIKDEVDLIELLQSMGVKTRKRKKESVAKALWVKAGIIYNEILDNEREVERKRIIIRNKKEAEFIKKVLQFARNPTTKTGEFALPRDEVMTKILTQLIGVKNKIKLEIGSVGYTLSIPFINKMLKNIANGDWLNTQQESRTSDEQVVYNLFNSKNFRLIILDDNVIRKKKGGAFFKNTHNIPDLDLKPYQINFTEDTYTHFEESCFIQAITKFFNNNDIDADAKISRAKSKMTSRTMTSIVIEKVALELGVSISIRDEREIKSGNAKSRTDIKNKGCDLTIPLGLIGEHYFLIEEVAITKYALVNFKELKDIDRWNEIYNKNNKRDKKRFISSYDVISYMYDNDEIYLTELDPKHILGSIHYDIGMDIDVYDVMEGDCREVEYVDRSIDKTGNKKEEDIICYFDFESTTNGDKHRAYLVVFWTDNMNEPKCIEGKFCGKRMMEEVARLHDYKPIRFIAHNVKYDFQFLYEHLYQVNKIQRGSMLLSARGEFYVDNNKCKFNFVDSYSFIATKLCKFPAMFGIKNIEKEIMPYNLWNTDTINQKIILLKDCVEYCDRQIVSNNIGREVSIEEKDDYYHSFVDKAKSWGCIIYNDLDEDKHSIDIMRYSKMYCIVDVEILKQGYTIFREWINEVCGLDINHYITLPSVADAYMKKSDVYKDCYEVSGSQLVFLQKCMVGGRTMTSENEMYNFTGDKLKLLDDLDAVSLYPSAMERMGGYLKGIPKVIQNKTYDFLKSVDGYFVEIKITKVGINKKFPLMSYITDKGIRLWTNDMVDKIIYVDKFALEDLIQFQKVEFDIIKGYYYDDGRNYTIGATIRHLFKTRLDKKREGNAIEQIYKLLMNSAYGRTLLKPFEEEKLYVKAKQEERHLVRHYDSIINTQRLHDNSVEITQLKPIVNHYNLVHIGCEVLSMSKRIMNEVMCLAEDIDIDIYYQDTDSTHTPVDKIPKLEEAYFKKYGRVLCGDEMGQFNCDFDSNKIAKKYLKLQFEIKYKRQPTDAEMSDKKIKKEFKIGIVSEESVFLGKKCYVDKLIAKGDDGGKLYGVDYHIRMKGVSGDAIDDKLCEEGINPIELYDSLYDGDAIEFDLCCRGIKACFESMKDGTMTTKDKFVRVIKFGDDEEEEE